jgi:hypothetical protein
VPDTAVKSSLSLLLRKYLAVVTDTAAVITAVESKYTANVFLEVIPTYLLQYR